MKKRNLGILVVTTLAVWAMALLNGFVWDELPLGEVKGHPLPDLAKIFLIFPGKLEYLPLSELSIALDSFIWGANPFGFHLTNLLLYTGDVLLVYLLAAEFLRFLDLGSPEGEARGWIALATALLFAVHPLHAEPVNFIGCRNNLLSGLFFLSCLCYLRHLQDVPGRWFHFGASLVTFALALLSKATVIVLPAVLLLILWISPRRGRLREWALLLPFFAFSIGEFFLYTQVGRGSGVISENALVFGSATLNAKLATAVEIPFFYLRQFFLPWRFVAEYDPDFDHALQAPAALAAALAVAGMIALALWSRRRWPGLALAAGWFLVTLLPVLNLFLTHPVVADRYAFIPSFGLAFGSAWALDRLQAWKPGMAAKAVFSLVLVYCSALSILQSRTWRSSVTLWAHSSQYVPTVFACNNLGSAHFAKGDLDAAFQAFARARELNPFNPGLDFHQGLLAYKRGDCPGALAAFRRALALSETLECGYYAGRCCERLGDLDQALSYYLDALRSPGVQWISVRGECQDSIQRIWALRAGELQQLRLQAEVLPGNLAALGTLAVYLDRLGKYPEALDAYRALERAGGGSWQVYYNMANVQKKLGNSRAAIELYDRSLSLQPRNADAYNNAGLLHRRLGEPGKAIECFQAGAACDPGNPFPAFNLASTYFALGDRERALATFQSVRNTHPQLGPQVAPFLKILERS